VKPETANPMSTVAARALRASTAIVLPLSLGACTWFTDFKNQPRIEPWESMSQDPADSLSPPRGQPQNSMPLQGTAVAAWQIGYTNTIATIDSFNVVPNPTPVSPASLENGKKNYQIFCATCHGMSGAGNGLATKYGMAGISLVNERVQGFKDGYIYGMIRNGRGIMPSYNRIEEPDRWDVINYVRELQKGAADTTLIGYPGQNGTTVPGPSQTAPTRPAPFLKPTQQPTIGSPNINSATFKGNNENDTMRKLHLGVPAAGGAAKEKH